MRDDRQKWDAPRDPQAEITGPGLMVTQITGLRQTLITGPRVLSQIEGAAGWPEIVTGARYALCLRRDQVLVIGGRARGEGWNVRQAQAISDATDAYSVVQIEGTGTEALLRSGTEISLGTPSRSVARQLFGQTVFLHRFETEDSCRLHVARAQADALWHAISSHLQGG